MKHCDSDIFNYQEEYLLTLYSKNINVLNNN